MQSVLTEYGVAATFDLSLYGYGDLDALASPTIAAGDFKISKDNAAVANPDTLPSVSPGASGIVLLSLTATELTAKKITVKWKDQTSPKEWEDFGLCIETYGHASSKHPNLDNVRMISGDATAADNLEAAADGTGFNLGGGSVVAASVTGAVGSVTAGVTLAASAVQAIWDALSSALTTAGSIGKRLVDFVTGDAYTRLGAPVGASISVDVAAVKADLVTLLSRITSSLFSGITSLAAWLRILARNAGGDAGALGEVNSGGGTFISGAHSLQAHAEVGFSIVIDTSDIKSRLPASLNGGKMDSHVGSMGTDVITTGALSAAAAQEIADAFLDRVDGVETGRTPRQAMRAISAALAGIIQGAGTGTVTIKALGAAGGGQTRIEATVDSNGNRSAVVLTL